MGMDCLQLDDLKAMDKQSRPQSRQVAVLLECRIRLTAASACAGILVRAVSVIPTQNVHLRGEKKKGLCGDDVQME